MSKSGAVIRYATRISIIHERGISVEEFESLINTELAVIEENGGSVTDVDLIPSSVASPTTALITWCRDVSDQLIDQHIDQLTDEARDIEAPPEPYEPNYEPEELIDGR